MRIFSLLCLISFALTFAACGDDDYGHVLDLGQDFSAAVDLRSHD